MNLRMIGAGSLGMLFAGKIASVVSDSVVLVAHSLAQADVINKEGLRYEENGIEHKTAIACSSFSDSCADRSDDDEPGWIFLMVKQQHITESLIRFIKRSMGEADRLLCFQNGIGHIERLSQTIPSEKIYAAVTTEGAKKVSDHTVRHTGRGTTWIGQAQSQLSAQGGEANNETSDAELVNLLNLLNKAGFTVYLSNEMDSIVWNKLLINSVINPLTAIMKVSNGQLLYREEWIRLMRSMYAEGVSVAHAAGIRVAPDLWERIVDVCERTADNHSSMLQDMLQNKKTEIDWITGSLLKLAEIYGLRLPYNEFVYYMIKGAEKG